MFWVSGDDERRESEMTELQRTVRMLTPAERSALADVNGVRDGSVVAGKAETLAGLTRLEILGPGGGLTRWGTAVTLAVKGEELERAFG